MAITLLCCVVKHKAHFLFTVFFKTKCHSLISASNDKLRDGNAGVDVIDYYVYKTFFVVGFKES